MVYALSSACRKNLDNFLCLCDFLALTAENNWVKVLKNTEKMRLSTATYPIKGIALQRNNTLTAGEGIS